jgi:predicted dehydrogenase
MQKTALTVAAATAASGLAPSIGVTGANDRINVGVIGCGGIAKHHIKMLGAIKNEDNVAIAACCDCYDTRANEYCDLVKETFGEAPKKYKTLEELVADPSLDKILIATPEHQHYLNTIAALEAGKKNIYLEKPMTKNTIESVQLMDAVEKHGAIVQVGVHTSSDDVFLAARDVIREGMIGKILQAQIDYCRHYYTRGPWRSEHTSNDPKPDDLDWETWIGPTKKYAWDARRYHNWRCYWDYSGGIATDLFIHPLTTLIKALDLQEPEGGIGIGDIYIWDDGRDIPDNYQMTLKYPDGPMVYILGTMSNKFGLQDCIRGDKGTLVFEGGGFNVYSEANETEGKEGYNKVIHTYQRQNDGSDDFYYQNNHRNHHQAMRSGDPSNLNCPVSLGHYAVCAVNVANEGYKQGRYMKWDKEDRKMVPA